MRKHSGMTLIGFIFVLIIAAFFALMAMRLVPPYIEYFGVVKAMKALANEPDASHLSLSQVRARLAFKASFQYVGDDTLNARAIRLERERGQVNLVVQYDKQVPFLYNVDFLLHFNKTVPMTGNAG